MKNAENFMKPRLLLETQPVHFSLIITQKIVEDLLVWIYNGYRRKEHLLEVGL
jgi:hypothetical protein